MRRGTPHRLGGAEEGMCECVNVWESSEWPAGMDMPSLTEDPSPPTHRLARHALRVCLELWTWHGVEGGPRARIRHGMAWGCTLPASPKPAWKDCHQDSGAPTRSMSEYPSTTGWGGGQWVGGCWGALWVGGAWWLSGGGGTSAHGREAPVSGRHACGMRAPPL